MLQHLNNQFFLLISGSLLRLLFSPKNMRITPLRYVYQLLKFSAAKTLLAAAILWLLLFQYGRYRFWRDPHSAFFNDRNVYDLKYSIYREYEAHHFVSRYNALSEPPQAVKGGGQSQ